MFSVLTPVSGGSIYRLVRRIRLQVGRSHIHHPDQETELCSNLITKNFPPLIGPKKGINKEIKFFSYVFLKTIGFKNSDFWLSPGVLEGLGRSGRLVGTISTYPGTYKCPGSRVMAKNPGGGFFFTEHGISASPRVPQERPRPPPRPAQERLESI